MSKKYGLGLKDIKLRFYDTSSGHPFYTLTSVGEVAEGSTQFVQEAPNETKFKGDYSDITLMTLFQMGDVTLETDIIEVNGEKMAALTGSTWTSGTKTVALPTDIPLIYAECELSFDSGLDKVQIVKGQVVANLNGANMKSEMFKLHLKVVAVPDSAGFVNVITK